MEDAEDAFEHEGVKLETYDEEFITDLIEAEYADAVKKIEGSAKHLGPMIDKALAGLT